MTHNAPAPKAQNLGTLFFTFFKIGLFTFGGGLHRGRLPAVLPHHLRHLAVF